MKETLKLYNNIADCYYLETKYSINIDRLLSIQRMINEQTNSMLNIMDVLSYYDNKTMDSEQLKGYEKEFTIYKNNILELENEIKNFITE